MRDGAPDAIVVGAGPAGLAAAVALHARGARVEVLEAKREAPIDKACGEGLMPSGIAALARLGIELRPSIGLPFRGIRFIDGRRQVDGTFPGPRGLGIRRLALHAALAAAARERGIAVSWGERLREVQPGASSVAVVTSRRRLEASWLVGADGLHSRVRRLCGLDAGAGPRRRFGTRRHFRLAPWSDLVEVHWGAGVEAYVTPVAPDLVGVAMLHGDPSRDFDDLLGCFPELARRLAAAPAGSSERGAGPLHRRVHAVARGRVALVGDAAGYLDAISGEGLALAFQEAIALAGALAGGNLSSYPAAHEELSATPLAVTRMLLLAERHPVLRRGALWLLARRPRLLSELLGVMVGAEGVRPSLVTRLAVAVA